jgi:hypothetical protein
MSVRTWSRFSAAFADDVEEFSERAVLRLGGELPTYKDVRPSDMREIAREGMGALVPVVADQRRLTPDEIELYMRTTEAQATQGVTLDDMLRAWQIGMDVLREWGHERTASEGWPTEVLVPFFDLIISWMNQGVAVSVDWYQAAARSTLWRDDEERTNFVRRVLLGGMTPIELKLRARAYGLSSTTAYFALRASSSDEGTLHKITSWLGLADDGSRPQGVVALVEGDVWGFAVHLPDDPIDIPVGVSAPTTLPELQAAFRLATRALDTAAALGLSGCHEVRALGVHPAVLEDDDVGAALVERFVEPLTRLGVTGEEMLTTVRAFLDHHGNYEKTGAAVFVHANTVRYRIRRFEELTGTCLRDTTSMVSVWWAIERQRLLGRTA